MVHAAGEMSADGVQLCTRCGYMLTDYRGAMVQNGSGPLVGWEYGASVEVITGNPRYSGITDEPPDCERLQ